MNTSPIVLSADSIKGDKVVNRTGDDLGKIEELMVDTQTGEVSYAVLSFGGFMGMGDKLFAVPWQSLQLDAQNKRFILDVTKEKLESAPGFDKDNWPDFADPNFSSSVRSHYRSRSAAV